MIACTSCKTSHNVLSHGGWVNLWAGGGGSGTVVIWGVELWGVGGMVEGVSLSLCCPRLIILSHWIKKLSYRFC